MPFKEKAIVRHKLRPDWGAGRVLQRSDEYLQIDFTAGGLIKLKTSIADDHLEAASDEEARALKPAKVKAAKRAVQPAEPEPLKAVVSGKAAVVPKASAATKAQVASKEPIAAKAGLGPKGIVPAKVTSSAKAAVAAKPGVTAKPGAKSGVTAKSAVT